MKQLKLLTSLLILIALLQLVISGCSSRDEIPVLTPDSTIVYPAKKTDGISARIILCKNLNKKTGKRIGAGTTFTLGEKENVRAFADLENVFKENNRDLMFHLVWISPDGNSFYTKRIDLTPADTSSTINSSIAISPDKRQPGNYLLQLYLYRELIAEKRFILRPEYKITASDIDNISASITLCRTIDKETGNLIGVDSVFIIREKAKVRAFVDMVNPGILSYQEFKFYFDWTDSSGISFYRKDIELLPDDSTSSLTSFIPISPEVQKPGKYAVRAYLSDMLIAEKKFELQNEVRNVVSKQKRMKASIVLCSSIDKETGKPIITEPIFTISKSGKVRAFIELENRKDFGERLLKFHLNWIGPDNKSFYRKQIELTPGDSTSSLNSSISITPDKRQPGKCSLQVYLFNELIAEKDFELIME
jgi:hypothetical protein